MKSDAKSGRKRRMEGGSRRSRRFTAWSSVLLTLAVAVMLSSAMVGSAIATGGNVTPLNGSDPRPFYIIAHNPNTLDEVDAALQVGTVDADPLANALEPDVTVADDCNGQDILVNWDSSSPNRGGDCSDVHLVDWMSYVHQQAIDHPELAMIMFDIKPSAASSDRVVEILNDIHTILNTGPVNLNIILNVASTGDAAAFDKAKVLDHLNPNEGVNIDAEDDVDDVLNFFFKQGYAGSIGYGDGTSFQGLFMPRAIDKAAFSRASIGYPRVISDVYTLNHDTSMHSFIFSGVDGIIPDRFGVIESGDPQYLHQLASVVDQHPEIRRATRQDNPWEPALQSYGLEVRTAGATPAEPFPGTDANIKFTLIGCQGQATMTVDTGNVNAVYDSRRMRDANLIDTPSPAGTDWVTIPSKNLGRLSSITVFNDGTGDAPGWHFIDIRVSSAGWLGPDYGGSREYVATFDDFLDGNASVPLTLTPNFTEPGPTIQCPAPIKVANAPGQCGAPVSFSPAVSDVCPGVTAASDHASGTTFAVGVTQVTSHAENPPAPDSPDCTFTVTVEDEEAPAITCPLPVVVNATGPQGGPASFPSPSVVDNCSVVASTSCTPPSGSVFPIGTVTVGCTAKDPAGNQSACTFTVHVKGAAEQTADLITVVQNLNTKPGVKNTLLGDLSSALAKLQSANFATACGPLGSFINDVNAQKGKSISVSDANALIAAAMQIKAVDGCS